MGEKAYLGTGTGKAVYVGHWTLDLSSEGVAQNMFRSNVAQCTPQKIFSYKQLVPGDGGLHFVISQL